MRSKAELKRAMRFFNQPNWPSSIVRSVALRITLKQDPKDTNNLLENTLKESAEFYGYVLVDEVRRLRKELRKQIKGNRRLSRALGLIKEHKGPVMGNKPDEEGVTVGTYPGPPGWGKIVVTAPPGMTVPEDAAEKIARQMTKGTRSDEKEES